MQTQCEFLHSKKQKFKLNVNFTLKKRKMQTKILNADLALLVILSVSEISTL